MTVSKIDRSRWRRVEMPPQIAALPRERERGFPIPYVAERAGPSRFVIEDTGPVLVVEWDEPEKPNLGLMDPLRQRQCMDTPRCQVCGEDLPKIQHAPLLFINSHDYDDHLRAGKRSYFTEPPVCESCCTYAIQVCPGILTSKKNHPRERNEGGIRMRVFVTTEVEMYEQVLGLSGEYMIPQGEEHQDAVTYFLAAMPTRYEMMTFPEYLAAKGVEPMVVGS